MATATAESDKVTRLTDYEDDSQYGDVSTRLYSMCGFALVVFVAVTSALRWSSYPVFVDTYYHMAVIEGFRQAGGIVTQAYWEMAPAGRVHIYPPALHAAGYLLTCLGLTPRMFITFVSWAFYPGCMLTTWLWLRRIAGPRSALFAVVLLSGPATFFWNQSAHTANAAVLVAAPLSLLALKTQRYLICAVLNFVTIGLHPMGLFLPPALVINTVLPRRNILAGFLAAAVPVLLYAPWLAHAWANRVLLPEHRIGGAWSLGGHGVNLGLVMAVSAALAIPWLLLRRGSMLMLIGTVLGFAVVFPMGFGGRFFMFNVHWPLACMGGFGLGELMRRLEKPSCLHRIAQVASVGVALTALILFPSLDLRLPPPRPGRDSPPEPPPEMRPGWQLGIQPGALLRLFDPYPQRPGPGPGPGPIGEMDLIHQPGVEEFFDAIRCNVSEGDVIFMHDPPAAALITGVTGRWTSNGMLHDVRLTERAPQPEDCDYLALVQQRPLPGPAPLHIGLQMQPKEPPGFEKVFENEFGSLWRNPIQPEHNRQPACATVGLVALLAVLATGLLLIGLDLLPASFSLPRKVASPICAVVVAVSTLPIARTAVAEFQNPPKPHSQQTEGPALPLFVEEIRHRHERLHDAVKFHFEHGVGPDYFWPPENEEHFHRLMQEGRFEEANRLLEEGLQILGEVLNEGTPSNSRMPRHNKQPNSTLKEDKH